MKWVKRIAIAIVALIAFVIIGGALFTRSSKGHDLERKEIEAQLDNLFTGGGSVGSVEGSPFGELVVRDVVIRDAARRPAISVRELRVRANLFDLLHKRVSLTKVALDGVDVELPAGALAHLMKPRPPSPPSTSAPWTIELSHVAIGRAHVFIDTRTPRFGAIDLDALELAGDARIAGGDAIAAAVTLTASWRQRATPIAISVNARRDGELVAAPVIDVRIGGLSLAAHELQAALSGDAFAGTVQVRAPRAELARLAGIELPDDVAVSIAAAHDGHVAIDGALGKTPITARLVADVPDKHLSGTLATGDVPLAMATHGKLAGTASAALDLDVAPGRAGELPIAHVTLHAHAAPANMRASVATIAIDSQADHATATVDVTGIATVHLAAAVVRDGAGGYRLDRGSLVASANDARLGGNVGASLIAHGPVWPSPALVVAGSVRGTKLALAGASARDVEVAFDARGVPAHPRGTVHVHAFDVAHGSLRVPAIAVDATSTRDGAIDIVHHLVRLQDGTEWSGSAGHVELANGGVAVRDFETASKQGKARLDASYSKAGDARATLAISNVMLGSLRKGYAGILGAHVDVQRTRGRLDASVAVDGKGLSLDPRVVAVDVHAKIDAHPGHIAVGARVASAAGSADLDVRVAAPANLADVAAWRRRGRDALELARIRVDKLDLGKIVPPTPNTIVNPKDKLVGIIDGSLEVTASSADGTIQLRGLRTPALASIGELDADLKIAQPAVGELAPELTVNAKQLGRATVALDVAMPAHPFDGAAWQQLGVKALHSATLRADNVAFDPGVLKRLGIKKSSLRGHASLDVDVAEGLASAHASLKVPDLRGSPLAKPVSASVDLQLEAAKATGTFALASDHKTAMADATISIPASIAQLRGDRAALEAMPLTGSLDLHDASAAQLLGAFGRTDVTGGTLGGKVTVAGTVGKPTAQVHLVATGLSTQPGVTGKSAPLLKQLALDGTWDGQHATVKLVGSEASGGTLTADAQASPSALGEATATVAAKSYDLAPLLVFAPGPAGGATGTLDGSIAVKSFDPKTAKVTGKLHVAKARLPIAPEVGTLREATLDVTIGNEIAISANGKLGQGTATAKGTIALDRFTPKGGQISIKLVHVSPIGAVQPLIDAQIAAKLSRTNEGWRADVTVAHGFVKLDTKGGEKLKPVGAPPDMVFGAKRPTAVAAKKAAHAKPQTAAFVAKITLQPTPIESDKVRTNVKGSLEITADLHGVDIKGQVRAVGGDVTLFDRRYRIDQAEVDFDGTPDPMLAVQISYDFTDMTLTAAVHGRASKPQLQLSSNPAGYTQSQLLGFLLGGEPASNDSNQPTSIADTTSAAGESFIGSQVGGFIKSTIPGVKIDVLKYQAASATSSEAVEAGSWITHSLFFQFTEHPEARPDENEEEGTLEWWFTHRLELQVTAGDRNYDGVDMLWRRRY
jgi:hypothetical protein